MEQGRANVYRGGGEDDGSDEEMNAGQVNEFKEVEATDDLLDEIDDVLEENAEEFVRAYVQKGGE